MIFNPIDADAGLLEDLTGHGIFQGLARLDESGDGRVPPDRPAGLTPQERALAVADQHDDGRIDPRELFMTAAGVGAHEHMPAFGGQSLRTAGAAEAVPPPPRDDG